MKLFIGLIYCFVLQFAETEWKNVWSGDTSSFKVENQSLMLDAEKTQSSASVSTKSDAIISASWHLCGKMNLNPSSSNYLAVYLTSTSADVADSTLSGYYLLLGKSNDEIALWKSVDGVQKKLGNSAKKRLNFSTVQYDIVVRTDREGGWTVMSRINEEEDYSFDFNANDNSVKKSSYFILNPHFSKTKVKHFSFDSISITTDFVDDDPLYAPDPEYNEALNSDSLEVAKKGDVVLNEVLFDVPTGKSEFIELYNKSEKWISAKSLKIATRKANGNLNYITPLSDGENDAIPPLAYVILSRNVENVCTEYDCGDGSVSFTLPKMPMLNNNGANVVLLDSDDNVLDELAYDPKMHSQFSNADKGRSLERVDFDLGDWTSASDECGGATPGAKNSASSVNPNKVECIQCFITSEYPELIIGYSFSKPNYKGTLVCFDRFGRKICTISDYQLLDREGECRWNGTDEKGDLLPTGIYVIVFEAVEENGSRIREKMVCTIGDR